MDSSGLMFMVIPDSLLTRSAEPFCGLPSATMPASSAIMASASMPIPLRTCARSRVEKRSPWERTRSL